MGTSKTMSKKNTLLIVLVLGCALVIVGERVVRWLNEEPEHIVVTIEAPLTVTKGEPFIFQVEVENTADYPQLLHSIDVYDEYLQGVAIQKTDPPFRESFHVPLDNTQSYEFLREIPAKGEVAVRFSAVGLHPGDYASYVDVCIKNGTTFLTYPLRTVVSDVEE